jgi:hypothetical protein
MNAPPNSVVVLVPVPVGTGDNGVHRRSKPDFRRHHRAVRPTDSPWRPQPIPQLDRDRLRHLVEQFRDAVRVQHEALLAQGRAMMAALRAA